MDQKKPLKLPPVLIALGRAVEVSGSDVSYLWPSKDNVVLYASVAGDTLYCVKTKKKQAPRSAFLALWNRRSKSANKGIELFEQWHDFDPMTGSIMATPKGFLYHVARAKTIVYASDKWTGRTVKYIHEFKQPPKLWVSSKTKPLVLVMTGGKIKVSKRGITG